VIRTQIQLSEEQHARLRALAAERGVSVAELVREGVERVLKGSDRRQRLWDRLRDVLGTHRDRDGAGDVSVRHDAYLAEAYRRGRGSR
jgi:hypothetical protein